MKTGKDKLGDPKAVTPGSRNDPRPADESAAHANRIQRIQEAAYRRAQDRGFSPGAELNDWLEAEREIDEVVNPAEPDARRAPDR